MSEQIFQPGDIVECAFYNGELELVKNDNDAYPLKIKVNDCLHTFTSKGKIDLYHHKPILKLIRRSKKMVTKTVERWVSDSFIFSLGKEYANDVSILSLDKGYVPDFILLVEQDIIRRNKITITFEAEE